jgi:hypothetical protein
MKDIAMEAVPVITMTARKGDALNSLTAAVEETPTISKHCLFVRELVSRGVSIYNVV